MKKRSVYDIYADILGYLSVTGRSRITRIARFANLPLDRAKKVLDRMVMCGLLRVERGDAIYYRITRRGYEYIEIYKRLRRLAGTLE